MQLTAAVTATATDNVRARPNSEGRESDLITTAEVGVRARKAGGRAEGTVAYDLARDTYLQTSGLNDFRHRLLGIGTAEVLEDRLLATASAAISDEDADGQGVTTATDRATPGNRATVANSSVGLTWRERMGQVAVGEASYRLADVRYLDTDVPAARSPSLNDTTIHDVSVQVSGGPRFTRFSWTLLGAWSETTAEDEGENLDQGTAGGRVEYRLNPIVSLLGSGGYDEVRRDGSDVTFDGTRASGPFYMGGIRLTPGPRTDLRLSVGERYGETAWEGALRYLVSARARVFASYAESVETQERVLARQLRSLTTDADGTFVDAATQLPANPNALLDHGASGAFRHSLFQAGFTGIQGRNTFSLLSFYSRRDYADGAADNNSRSWGAAGQVDRRLSPRLSAGISAGWARLTASAEPDQTTVRGGIHASYALSPSLTGTLSYAHLHRSGGLDGTVRENAIMARIGYAF